MSGFVGEALRGPPEPLTAAQQERFERMLANVGNAMHSVERVLAEGLRALASSRPNAPTLRHELQDRIADLQVAMQICINAADLDEGEIGDRRRKLMRLFAQHEKQREGGAA